MDDTIAKFTGAHIFFETLVMRELIIIQPRYQYVALKEATQVRSYVNVIGIVKNFRGPSKTTTGG